MDNANTQLYYDLNGGLYCSYRTWDGGWGSLTLKAENFEGLVRKMQESRDLFAEPFRLEGRIPQIESGNLDSARLKPLEDNLVKQAVELLREH